jgi:hypothetical protein
MAKSALSRGVFRKVWMPIAMQHILGRLLELYVQSLALQARGLPQATPHPPGRPASPAGARLHI